MQHLINQVHNLDALDFLALIEPQSVDAIITDLPYGTTACKWDTIIPFEPMWAAVKRVLKPRGVFVTTASQPFTSALVMSNPAWFRCEWVWDKVRPVGFQIAKYRPMMQHENILVFSDSSPSYYPQMSPRLVPRSKTGAYSKSGSNPLAHIRPLDGEYSAFYPSSLLMFSNADQTEKQHPTQKPVALYEYLISTYTLPGELVVDPCCGSGTTGVAARNLKRDYILNDKEAEYVEITRDRLRGAWDKRRRKESDLSGLPLFDGMIDEENHS